MIYELIVNNVGGWQNKKKGQPIGQPLLSGCRLSDILVKTLLPNYIDRHVFIIINSYLHVSLVRSRAAIIMPRGQNVVIILKLFQPMH